MQIIFALLLLLPFANAQSCPFPETVSPCKCSGAGDALQLTCNRNEPNPKQSFDSIANKTSQRFFRGLFFRNTHIDTLSANTTNQLLFEEIRLYACTRLQKIHSQAFWHTRNLVKNFHIQMDNDQLDTHPQPYDLFELLNGFVHAKSIGVQAAKLSHINDNALSLTRLQSLAITNSKRLETIGQFAFWRLERLISLVLSNNSISNVQENSFNFNRTASDNFLQINLNNNRLKSSSFAVGSLTHFNRPVLLNLANNQLDYLNETIFKPFLDLYSGYAKTNEITDLRGNRLNCSDCRNHWLVKDQCKGQERYKYRVAHAYCDGDVSRSVFDHDWSGRCKSDC